MRLPCIDVDIIILGSSVCLMQWTGL